MVFIGGGFRGSLKRQALPFLWSSPLAALANRPTLPVFWSHAQFRTGLKFTYGEKGEGVEGSLEFGGRGEERIGARSLVSVNHFTPPPLSLSFSHSLAGYLFDKCVQFSTKSAHQSICWDWDDARGEDKKSKKSGWTCALFNWQKTRAFNWLLHQGTNNRGFHSWRSVVSVVIIIIDKSRHTAIVFHEHANGFRAEFVEIGLDCVIPPFHALVPATPSHTWGKADESVMLRLTDPIIC